MTTQATRSPTTLPGRYYTDPDVFREELERFYCQTWICAGRAGQISRPGDYFLRHIAGESVIVARDASSEVRAFYNVCRHRGTRLCTSAEGAFPWRIQDLQMHKRIVYEVQANWKLIVINYNECLHCPVLHPCLNRLTNYLGADNSLPQPTYIGGAMGFRGDAQTMSLDGKLRRDYLPGLNEEQRTQVYYYAIYPNLFLSPHPDYMMTHTLWPRAVDRTEVVCEWHFHPAEIAKPDFHADDAIDFWDLTNREDW